MKVIFLAILIGSVHAAQLQGGASGEFQNAPSDTAAVDSGLASSPAFVGIDPVETRLTVAFVLLFVLIILAVLLTMKIQAADRRAGIQ